MRLKSLISPKFAAKAFIALVASIGGFSCNSVIDDSTDHPCGLAVRFVYDYNMEYANSFPKKVDCVKLLVFKKDGEAYKYVTTLDESSDALKSEDYRMRVELLERGEYRLIAYGGLACDKKSFDLYPFEKRSDSESITDKDLAVEMHYAKDTGVQDKALHNLYFGTVDVAMDNYDYQEKTVYMMKDTNNFRVILQQIDGEVISDKQFDCYITDDNSYLDYKNDVVPTRTITYKPWAQGQEFIDDATWEDQFNDQLGPVTAAYYELSTSRLIWDDSDAQGANSAARLVIKNNETGKDVINIPLIKYLMLYRSQLYADMPEQEFLDRESEWTMAFFLDANNRWVNVYIIVNDWVVRLNSAEL